MKHASFFRDQDEEISGIVSRFLDESMSESGDALDARRAHLAVLASLIGCQGLDAFRAELAVALDDGLRPEEAREVVCQSIAYLGVGRSAPFVTAMYDVFAEYGVKALEGAGMLPDDERAGRGSSLQAEMFGNFMKDAWKAGTVNRWLAANCFGDYYTRGNLTLADREMATFCYLMAQGGCEPQLEAHIKGNMNMGNDTGSCARSCSAVFRIWGIRAASTPWRASPVWKPRGRRVEEDALLSLDIYHDVQDMYHYVM